MEVESRTGDPFPFISALLQALRQQHDATLIRFGGRDISNAQVLIKTLKLARLFRRRGLADGAVVAVCMQRRPELLVTLLALWCCGAVYLPLDRSWPRRRQSSALEIAEARCLLTQEALRGEAELLPCPFLLLEDMDFASENASPVPGLPPSRTLPDPEDPAYILFTSGSSGSPKGVAIRHRNLDALFTALLPLLQLAPGTRFLACNSFCFDIAMLELLGPILCRGSLVLCGEDEYTKPAVLCRLIRDEHVDLLQLTPSMWSLLLQCEAFDGLSIRRGIAGGEALSRIRAAAIYEHCDRLWNLYGPTECTLWCSAFEITGETLARAESRSLMPIGRPLECASLSLARNAGKDTGAVDGELLIAGPCVGAGYLNASERDARRFTRLPGKGDCFLSGDRCRLDADGNYHFTGRIDGQDKLNGYRIEPGEIALRLEQHASIRQAVCLVKKREAGDQLLAFIVCEPDTPNRDRSRLNAHLAQWLPRWMLPQRYLVLDALPLNANGKTDHAALLRLSEAGNSEAPTAGPDMQSSVSRIFREVLDLEHIGPYDSFFDAGGNSMLCATLLMYINERFDARLSLTAILQTPPTVAALCRLLSAEGHGHCGAGDPQAAKEPKGSEELEEPKKQGTGAGLAEA